MKNKSEALDMFKMYVTEIENQLSKKIKRLRNDRGTRYDSGLCNDFYSKHGIVHETTTPYSPEMNGKAERKNITLIELVVSVMMNYGVAPYWWGEILLIVFYALNNVPKSKSKISPCDILKKRQPNLSYLRTWVCLAYATNSKTCKFYDLNEKVIIESNDVEFYENKFPFKSRNSGGTQSSHIPMIRSTESDDNVETELR